MADTTHTPKVEIKIAGNAIEYSQLNIEQSIAAHHRFRFLWRVGTFQADISVQQKLLKDNIGKEVSISIGGDAFKFVGLITEMTIDERNEGHSFHVSGQSPTILLEDCPRSTSYYKKTLSDIVTNTFKGIPSNFEKTINPTLKEPLHYLAQYNETDFLFLSRLASRYGEWFYYDGQNICFGEIKNSGVVLMNGVSLQRLSIRASLQPDNFAYSGYDAHKGEKLDGEMKPAESSNDFAKPAAEKSKSIFSRKDDKRKIHAFNVVNKKQMDSLKDLDTKGSSARLLTISGSSTKEGLKPGHRFKIDQHGNQIEYIVTSVSHSSSLQGNYENSFTAVPGTVEAPPYTSPHVFRKCEPQPAVVKDNKDSDKLGRVKVKFPWSEESPWLRITTPHSGNEKGWHFIPEIGEDVMVDFEGGDVDKPFVAGSLYQGQAKPGQGDDDNNYKMLRTRSGNEIIFSDEDGKEHLLIANKDLKNQIKLHFAEKEITIQSEGHILIKAESIDIKADKAINIEAGEELTIKSGKAMTLNSQDAMKQDAMKEFKISTMDKLSTSSMKDTKIAASMNLSLEGTIKAEMKGAQAAVSGTAQATVKAAIVMIN